MAYRPKGFGLSAELARKKERKFDPDLASDCAEWIRVVLDDGGYEEEANSINIDVETPADFIKPLKDGIILCKVLNVIKPGSVKKINTSKAAFKIMENIEQFLNGCQNIGVKKLDMFQSVDLYEAQNVPQVVNGIVALGRKAQSLGYDGASLGPTESSINKREFTPEQLRAGQGIIGLQAGSNRGASQAGLNFGKTRAIID